MVQTGVVTSAEGSLNRVEIPGGLPVGNNGGYGIGDIRQVLPPNVLAHVDLDPEMLTRVDPEKWRELFRAARGPVSTVTDARCPANHAEIADRIIQQITTRARLASMLGSSYAVLASVNPLTEIDSSGTTGLVHPEDLTGVAKMVWDHCVNASASYPAKCQPTLDYWADLNPEGWRGWNIVIHFDPSSKVQRAAPDQVADWAIKMIPARAVLESLCARPYASIFSFREGDEISIEKDPTQYPGELQQAVYAPGQLQPHMLKGPAAQVWTYCLENNLHPTLEYWDTVNPDDPEGERISGYEIVAHWFYPEVYTEDERAMFKAIDAEHVARIS